MNLETFLKELKELESKATPGPWKSFDNGPWGGKGAGLAIGEDTDHWVVFGEYTIEPHVSNSRFTEASRTAIPKLIAIIEELSTALRLSGCSYSTALTNFGRQSSHDLNCPNCIGLARVEEIVKGER